MRFESYTTDAFWHAYRQLPESVRRKARKAYRLFSNDPSHPSLKFKRIHTRLPIYSARVDDDYRVIGSVDGDEILWLWIGKHADYDSYIRTLR
jgi:hypothetical protein